MFQSPPERRAGFTQRLWTEPVLLQLQTARSVGDWRNAVSDEAGYRPGKSARGNTQPERVASVQRSARRRQP